MNKDNVNTPDQRHVITRMRLEPRRRMLHVSGVERLTPAMVRVHLTSPDLADFHSPGADDHIKLFFPDPAGGSDQIMRDFTPRMWSQEACSLAIDFALHESGPASNWARHAGVGDTLQIGGPRGSTVVATDFDWYVLVGDETALPAIGRRLEELPEGSRAFVFVAVDTADHVIELTSRAACQTEWLCRDAPGYVDDASALTGALREMTLPEGDGYVWVAAEASVAKQLRRLMVEDRHHPAQWLKAAGYWQQGQIGVHEPL